MYFPFFKPQTGGKRFAAQPQTIYPEFPLHIIRLVDGLQFPEGVDLNDILIFAGADFNLIVFLFVDQRVNT